MNKVASSARPATTSVTERPIGNSSVGNEDVFAVFVTAGLLLAVVAVLRFSSWAEGWLASSPRPVLDVALDAKSSVAGQLDEPESALEAVPVA